MRASFARTVRDARFRPERPLTLLPVPGRPLTLLPAPHRHNHAAALTREDAVDDAGADLVAIDRVGQAQRAVARDARALHAVHDPAALARLVLRLGGGLVDGHVEHVLRVELHLCDAGRKKGRVER